VYKRQVLVAVALVLVLIGALYMIPAVNAAASGIFWFCLLYTSRCV